MSPPGARTLRLTLLAFPLAVLSEEKPLEKRIGRGVISRGRFVVMGLLSATVVPLVFLALLITIGGCIVAFFAWFVKHNCRE